MTLIEVMMMAAVVAVLILPLMKFTTGVMKWFVTLDARHKGEEVTRIAMVDIERDLKDMNEIFLASGTFVIFGMDSHRMPTYNLNGDSDGDGIGNQFDNDDDGDGFDVSMTATRYRNLADAIRSVGWRQGLDLMDDDDNNDGFRDVLCRYEYFASSRALTRCFNYNGMGFGPRQVVAKDVISFSFNYSGAPTFIDPNTGSPPTAQDLNGDGILSLSEIDGLPHGNGNGFLDTLREVRCVVRVGYRMVVQPNRNLPGNTQTSNSSIMPPLMSVKEKFR